MMKLHIRKSSLRIATVLYYGGLVALVASLPVMLLMTSHVDHLVTNDWLAKRVFSVFIPGSIMAIVGAGWKSDLFHCPQCDAPLLGPGLFSWTPPQYCNRCGVKIDIIIDDKK